MYVIHIRLESWTSYFGGLISPTIVIKKQTPSISKYDTEQLVLDCARYFINVTNETSLEQVMDTYWNCTLERCKSKEIGHTACGVTLQGHVFDLIDL